MSTLLLILSTFSAGVLAGVVMLACFMGRPPDERPFDDFHLGNDT